MLPAGATPVALGRHALALVARVLRERGIGQVAIPGYHCLTMVLPFQLEGFRVAHVPVGLDLMADPGALLGLVGERPEAWAILHTDVFGADPGPELVAALCRAREAGAVVVADDTHRWPFPSPVPADYRVASIRKLLGLADGAYVTGLPAGLDPAPRAEVDAREEAAWLAGDVDLAEDLMDDQLVPVPPSASTLAAWEWVDVDALVERRRRAGIRLSRAIDRLPLRRISPDTAHFCVAFRAPGGADLAVDLARRGVDGPVWWPRPRGWTRPWPDDVVTLPLGGDDPDDAVERWLRTEDAAQ